MLPASVRFAACRGADTHANGSYQRFVLGFVGRAARRWSMSRRPVSTPARWNEVVIPYREIVPRPVHWVRLKC